jgi:hypothetical protein
MGLVSFLLPTRGEKHSIDFLEKDKERMRLVPSFERPKPESAHAAGRGFNESVAGRSELGPSGF